MTTYRVDSRELRNLADSAAAPASSALVRAWDRVYPPHEHTHVDEARVSITVQNGGNNECYVQRQFLRPFVAALLNDSNVKQIVVDNKVLAL